MKSFIPIKYITGYSNLRQSACYFVVYIQLKRHIMEHIIIFLPNQQSMYTLKKSIQFNSLCFEWLKYALIMPTYGIGCCGCYTQIASNIITLFPLRKIIKNQTEIIRELTFFYFSRLFIKMNNLDATQKNKFSMLLFLEYLPLNQLIHSFCGYYT